MQLKDLPIGSKVVDLDTKYFGEPIVWEIIDKNHSGYPENSVTLLSESILCVKSFDAKEPANGDSNRKNYGNNRYKDSNIRQWLNSDLQNWFEKQHGADEPPNVTNVNSGWNPYDTEKGFLANFSSDFKKAILPTELKVAKNTVTDGGGLETVIDRVFLLSNTEVGLANEPGGAEGVKFNVFSSDATRVRRPTQKAVSNSNYTNTSFNANSGWHYWLRTPYSGYSVDVRRVDTSGSLNYNYAFSGNIGVLPALNLKSDILVSENSGMYILSFDEPPSIRDVNISRTNVRGGNIEITCTADDVEDQDIQYSVMVNDLEVVSLSELQPTPADLNIQVPTNFFEVGDNLLKLVVIDENGGESSFEYIVIKEDRDTFKFIRRFDFKEDYITDENIKAIYGEGLALNSIGVGEVNLSIPTEGKSRIKNIQIESNIVPTTNLTFEDEMTYVMDLGAGKVYEAPIKIEYKNIVELGVV